MSIRSLLVEIIPDLIQKILRVTTRSDPNTKTEETYMARVIGEAYEFGCSPVAEVNVLEHGGKYPQILDPDTKTEETHIARVLGEAYEFSCSPVAEAEIVKVLDHAKNYPSINES